jgi:HSP20 family protein
MLAWREGNGSWVPPVDVYENDDSWTVTMELPGVILEELDINVSGDMLQVSGTKRLPEGGSTALRLEIPTGSFMRELHFTGGVDVPGVTASLAHGLLSVRLPKSSRIRVRIPLTPRGNGSVGST